ncbi:hypothetical protein B0H66DRAFT_594540 [Apodospora peruviana]|uniref:Uncharacterized protein n=1 Tax=Apodospora peruviana TaxID=516989 RepID=A0AAE0LXY6_9PEZI|nr:hypothetical protein B0H66DRAFT_506488 [Apodospora peruviana]KAK3313691.1 hypothetical protein B0H66DRAFT_594540 [Apodospora peruviana]
METSNSTNDGGAFYSNTLSPPAEFLAPCPKFRVLVLGNPEATKQEIFAKIFGVDLEKKQLAAAFHDKVHHPIDEELDLLGQNEHLTVFTSPNFGAGDERAYKSVCDFLHSHSGLPDEKKNIHCIWYCVASEEQRAIHPLETKFFANLVNVAPHIPVVLLFTKYDDFVSRVELKWSKNAQQRGLSKVAVTHILRDLSTKRFEKTIGSKWDEALHLTTPASSASSGKHIQRVCVASDGDGDGEESFEKLAVVTLAGLRDRSIKLAYAVAQRNSAFISTQFCADTAAEYFSVDTGHARKLAGVDMRDIIPNFFAKAVRIFNMRDISSILTDAGLLTRILTAAFGTNQRPLLSEILSCSLSTEQPTMLLNLSPHERAVLLTQSLVEIVLFLHKLADTQWPHRENFALALPPPTLTARTLERELDDFLLGHEKNTVLEVVEGSTIFSSCPLKKGISDLISSAVEQAVSKHDGVARQSPSGKPVVIVEDSDLQEISLSFVNDKSPDDMILPCGLRILPLN